MVIYTASLSKYADPLMDILDPKGLCTSRLFREHCTFYDNRFVKDLSKIDRDPKDLFILDNSQNSYLFQPESALPIVSWYDDMSDTILFDYIPILQGLAIVDDVREALPTFVYPEEEDEYNRIDIDRGIDVLNQYIIKARENLIPEYKSKLKNRVFSEPRQFHQANIGEEDQDDIQEAKQYQPALNSFQDNTSAIMKNQRKTDNRILAEADSMLQNNTTFYGTNGSLPSAKSEVTSPLMNTWTNNKLISNNKEMNTNPQRKKMNTRPKSGNPSPTKMEPRVDRVANQKLMMSYNSRQNNIYNPKQYDMNEAVILQSYSNTKQNITPGTVQAQMQSSNPPQPHQRQIKKGMMAGSKHSNLQSDMYKIYGITRPDFGNTSLAPTPKTSSGKRDNSAALNSFGLRVNNQAMQNRGNQKTSHGTRSVSPGRILPNDDPSDQDMNNSQRPNAVDVLKFQARTNLKNLEKGMASMIGKHKKMIKKKKNINKTGMKYYTFSKLSPTHKRVKSTSFQKDPIVGIHKRFMSNKTPYNPSPLNRNMQMEGKGFGFGTNNTFSRVKDTRGKIKKPYTRNQSRKKYRMGNSEE